MGYFTAIEDGRLGAETRPRASLLPIEWMYPMTIFFSVGEPSGDLHGANLIRAIRDRSPGVECVGYGGPRMAAAGARLHADLTQLAIMGVVRAVLNLHRFWGLYRRARRYLREARPDAVVLIDYPGFNWWVARAAKAQGIPVFYYGTPQLWAWGGWRVRKMRRLVDHVLCKLPFEEDWFRARGVSATFVGHPYFDELTRAFPDEADRPANDSPPLVTILPGSRTQEVTGNLPMLLRAAKLILRAVPDVQFAVASYNDRQAELAREMVRSSGVPAHVHVHRTGELIRDATCAMGVSGSVSLELLYHATPAVLFYKISRASFFIQQFFRKARYITLANLVAVEDPFALPPGNYDPDNPIDAAAPLPEYLTWEEISERTAGHLVEWLTDEAARQHVCDRLRDARRKIGHTGASQRAAEYILGALPAERDHRSDAPAAA